MATRPRKPWRVILTASGRPVPDSETEHTSELKTYQHAHTALRSGVADTAKLMQWDDGRWWHFETLHADEIAPEEEP